jgi:hypothetical protein
MALTPADLVHFPARFSAHRDAADSIRLECWNEDGTGDVTISLTHSTALELVAALSATLASNPYAR